MRTIQNVEIVFEGGKQQPEMHLQLHEFFCLVPLLLLNSPSENFPCDGQIWS